MTDHQELREWLESTAPQDVLKTVAWLERNGYELTGVVGDANSIGRELTYEGRFTVLVTWDRGQWSLDVARRGGKPVLLDLIAAGWRGEYPALPAVEERHLEKQTPSWISWHEELPVLLDWLDDPESDAAIAYAQEQRFVLMWPDSGGARRIRAKWRREGREGRDVPRLSPKDGGSTRK